MTGANPLDFTGKTALVVGGSSGIGNGIARAFLDAGAQVLVWGTRPDAADYSASEGSDLAGLLYSQVDAADWDGVERAARDIPAVDIVVLCQGTVVYGRGEFERDGWDRVMGVNLDSLMACARAFRPALRDSAGSLIIVSSISGYQANRGNPAYAASKAGAIGLTRTLGQAWAPDGIRVNGIAPGMVATKLTKVTTDHPGRLDRTLAAIPLGRMGQPSELGSAALFLASPLASYVIGHTLVVDGGLLL
ncbi:3-oxoacyl-ACP reductase [Sphingobium sp. TA15]|uniref:SDR-family protein n=1 Tax=Sphingobium indicum (strain DSM 16413 / CCM 7287 / MTCC 6362 / UT26 / NBRC 101211 / UT26S) TaxID=452662 RepID=D4Z4J8_SPHIU|nr:SDR family oxidoreductase [Sphingobium indicum]BAI97530.1 SDR-family protein [Sphingobium indicum UT26S]BDD66941.1 3-oxoacyl-ACP reductase [Sphingobium sp. TA15]